MWMLECTPVCVSALVFIRFLHVNVLIVCVGNNSPIPQGMKQAWKRPGPNIQRPPGHGTPRRNHRRDNRGLHPEKGGEEPEGGTSDSHSVGAPGCRGGKPQAPPAADHPRADRALGPETQRPPPHNRGPARPVGQAPPIDRREWAGARPSILPRREKSPTPGGILHRQGMVVGWGSTKMMSEAESKARPDT